MTLRDYFAAAVQKTNLCLPGTNRDCANALGITDEEFNTDPLGNWYKIVARERYRYADAMIAEKEKK